MLPSTLRTCCFPYGAKQILIIWGQTVTQPQTDALYLQAKNGVPTIPPRGILLKQLGIDLQRIGPLPGWEGVGRSCYIGTFGKCTLWSPYLWAFWSIHSGSPSVWCFSILIFQNGTLAYLIACAAKKYLCMLHFREILSFSLPFLNESLPLLHPTNGFGSKIPGTF